MKTETSLALFDIDFPHSWEQQISTASSGCTQSQFKAGKLFEVRLTTMFFILCKLVSLEAALGEGGRGPAASCGLLPVSVWHRIDALWRLRFPTAALCNTHKEACRH